MEVSDRKISRLNFLVKELKKIRSVQGGLLQLSELASKVQDLTEFYPQLNHVVSSILQADNFYVALENQNQELELVYFVDEKDDSTLPEAKGIENGITGYVYSSGQSVLCDKPGYLDMVNDGKFAKLGSEPELWFGVPFKRGSRSIGVMAIQSYSPITAINEQTIALFEHLGSHLMTAINRIKRREFLVQEVKRQTSDLQNINLDLQHQIKQRKQAERLQQVLFEISEMSASNLKMEDFYNNLHISLAQLMDVKNCYIALVEEDMLSFPFFVDKYREDCATRKMVNGLTEYTIKQKSCQLIDKERASMLEQQGLVTRQVALDSHVSTCWLGAPLIIDDQVIGVITVQSYDNESDYTDKDLQLLNFVSHHIARAIERKLASQALQQSYDELEKKISERTQELRQANLFLRLQVDERKKAEQKLFYQANHDALTGLPNRSCFLTQVEQTLARAKRHPEHKFALLFIDLDNFKQINDNYGHQAGDEFLIEVSRRLSESVRDNDAVARLGGDEFVVLLDLIPNNQLAEDIATRVIDKIALPYQLKSCEVRSGASIGIAMFERKYHDVESIMQDADLAMYQAKALGRGQFVVFEPSMRESDNQNNLAQVLQSSLAEKSLSLKLQPIVSQSSQQVSCQLVQTDFDCPEMQQFESEQWLSQLQHYDLMVDFDNLQLELLDASLIQSSMISLMPISCQHLTHLKLTKSLIERVNKLSQPASVCLLFSETELTQLKEPHFANIKQLKRAGVKVGIHRFGEANMTLGLLAKVAIDFIVFDDKLVKSVAANPAEFALLSTTIDLCSKFKIRPVISGIEREQHVERANELHVDLICGAHITEEFGLQAAEPLTIQHSA